MSDYMTRTAFAIKEQCERREIPQDEHAAVLAHIEAEMKVKLEDMTDYQLKKLNQRLDGFMVAYLGGFKRKGGPGAGGPAAAAAGSMEVTTE